MYCYVMYVMYVMYVCMYVCMYGCMYVCMYVGMYVCMHACMYVCMYQIFIQLNTSVNKIYPSIYIYKWRWIKTDTILRGWTFIYQPFWCSPGVQALDPSPCWISLPLGRFGRSHCTLHIAAAQPKRHKQGLRELKLGSDQEMMQVCIYIYICIYTYLYISTSKSSWNDFGLGHGGNHSPYLSPSFVGPWMAREKLEHRTM